MKDTDDDSIVNYSTARTPLLHFFITVKVVATMSKKISQCWYRIRNWQLQKNLTKRHAHCFEIFTHLTIEERILLYRVAKLKRNAIIVEIGSYLGASASFLAAGAMESKSEVHCVDNWTNIGMSEGERDTFEEFKNNVVPYSDCIRIHKGLSADVARTRPPIGHAKCAAAI